MPNAPGDPCPQVKTECAGVGRLAISMCQADGTWATCLCQQGNALSASMCGNNVKDPGTQEQCDGPDLANATCASLLGASYGGSLFCTPGCILDTSMCIPGTAGTGGSAGTGG